MSELNIPGFIAFLRGEVTIDGHWFGGDGPIRGGIRRNFWWREHLPKLSAHIERQDAEIAQLRADLSESRRLLDEARAQKPAIFFPRQPNGDGGWVIDANYVAAIRKDCFPIEWQPCEEEVEAVLLAVERAAPVPAQPADYVGWYCAHCQTGVDSRDVTFSEQHNACGRVITDDRPPAAQPAAPDFIPALYSWLARAHFDRQQDEVTASRFGQQLHAWITAQPAVCDDCGALCTPANNAKSHIKRCAACQSAFVASLDSAITAQPAVPEAVAKDAARLDFLIAERAIVQNHIFTEGARFWVSWPVLGEDQRNLYKSPREAIDAAILSAADTEVKKDDGR